MNGKKLKLVVCDLAGTVIDFGSRAPAGAFVELFKREGIQITEAHAREPMGMHKRDHIAAICSMPEVAVQTGGCLPDSEIERLYKTFIPLQMEVLSQYGDLIPGAVEAINRLRAMGVSIAFTTGYSREMMEVVLNLAKQQGLEPDTAVSGTDVPAGRPAPWMAIECARRLDIYPISDCLKIGDTLVDIQAGLNAGMHSVGVTDTGNLAGYALNDWLDLNDNERQHIRTNATVRFQAVGANHIIPSVADLPNLVEC